MAAASDASGLSDAQLRAELKRLGFNPGPVTNSTRPLLVKKLLRLQGEDKQLPKIVKKPVPSRKLLGFSSDESDTEHNGSAARSRNASAKTARRRSVKSRPPRTSTEPPTINNADVPKLNHHGKLNVTPKSTQSPRRASLGRSARGGDRGTVSLKTSRVNSRLSLDGSAHHAATAEFSDSDVDVDQSQQVNGNMAEEEEEDEDEDDEVVELEIADVSSNTSNRANSRSSLGLGRRGTLSQSRGSFNSTYSLQDDDDPNDQTPVTEPAQPFYNKTPRTSTPRRPTRSRLGDQMSSKKMNSTTAIPDDASSSFRNRYNRNATPNTRPSPGDNGDSFSASRRKSSHETNHTGGSPTNRYADGSPAPADDGDGDIHLAQEFATEENLGSSLGSKYGHSYVPMVLLMCAFLFFVSLAVMYVSVGALDKRSDLQDDKLLCSESDANKFQCLKIVEALYVKLSELAGQDECDQLPEGEERNMTIEQARRFLKSTFKMEIKEEPFWYEDNILTTWKLILHNEQWGLRLFSTSGQLNNKTSEDTLTNKVKWMDSTHLHMPWLCRVQRSAVLVLFRVCMIVLVVLLSWLLILYVRYRLRRDEEEKTQVHQLVEKIIEMLSNHSRACSRDKHLPPYLAIPHVRDTLIPLAERKKKQKLWNRAVQFLNATESRVRVETQQVSGEEFPVWRWVQPSSVVIPHTFAPITEQGTNPNRTKVWQGTAFDNIDSAVKAPSYTPTPCLKIRNMFDITLESGSNWNVAIEDAILEKCVGNIGIVHVAVDKNSREGCVYMKCQTPEHAGQAYRALQGSWFDGKLVTVKYLRLDRYHQRFPNATACNTPLQPSNNLKKSLSRPPHSSALESS